MLTIRKSDERGRMQLDWLDTRHTFSFGDYYDPQWTHFRSLRVINDDIVAPKGGFGTHPHRDMEIITYPLSGALEHRDSLGSGSVIRAGDVQRMSAGSGILHSEFNPSADEPVRLLQIWIFPDQKGLTPEYEERHFDDAGKRGRLRLITSRDGHDGSVTIHQDAELYAALLAGGQTVRHELRPGRHAWVQVARGSLAVNGQRLEEGDGAGLSGEAAVELTAAGPAELLVFDLA
jgi:redox-sensitive bicupin YhaK (pirin superfamily)